MSQRASAQGGLRFGLVSDHLFPFAHGGAERVYRVLADAIVAEGNELTYFTRRQWDSGSALETAFAVREVWAGEVYDANGTRQISAALRWSRALLRALWSTPVNVLVVSATPVFNVFVALLVKVRHPHTLLVVDWLEIWPARKWRAYSGVLAGSIAWMLQSFAVHVGGAHLVNSAVTRARLPKRAQRSAIMLPLNTMAGEPVKPTQTVVPQRLLFVGRHIPDKNLPMLPRVVAALQSDYPELSAVVIGDGPDRAATEALALKLGVSERMSFLGRVSDEVLEHQLAEAGVLFFPSVREGFGLVVCEAARHGTPVVLVAHEDNAATLLLEPGVNGAFAGRLSLDELVAATRACLEGGPELRTSAKAWYDRSWNASGGFAEVARQLVSRYRRSASQ